MIRVRRIPFRFLIREFNSFKQYKRINASLISNRYYSRFNEYNYELIYSDSSWEGGAKEIEITSDIIKKYKDDDCNDNNYSVEKVEQLHHYDWSNVDLEKLIKDESWIKEIGEEFKKPYMIKLTEFLHKEGKTKTLYPPCNEVFNALNLCPFNNIKVVIIGQDPYHNPGQAHGLCFSVKSGAIPPSLINIFKELKDDIKSFKRSQNNGNLESWCKQGVLLLNACLSVEKNKPNSHKDKGWEILTDRIIEKINLDLNNVVFILWGKYAQNKERLINGDKHCILKAAHPSPLSANKGFFGCKHFSKTNEFLLKHGKDPINWDL